PSVFIDKIDVYPAVEQGCLLALSVNVTQLRSDPFKWRGCGKLIIDKNAVLNCAREFASDDQFDVSTLLYFDTAFFQRIAHLFAWRNAKESLEIRRAFTFFYQIGRNPVTGQRSEAVHDD